MDIISKKILSEGDTVFFFRSIVNKPFTYLLIEGIIRDVYDSGDDHVSYTVKVKRLHDSDAHIRGITGERFMVEKGTTKYRRAFPLLIAKKWNTANAFCDILVTRPYFISVMSLICFESIYELQHYLINTHIPMFVRPQLEGYIEDTYKQELRLKAMGYE